MLDVRIARRRQNWYLASLTLGDEPERPIALRCECGDERCDELVWMPAADFREVVYCHRGFVSSRAHPAERRKRDVVRRRQVSTAGTGGASRRALARSRRG